MPLVSAIALGWVTLSLGFFMGAMWKALKHSDRMYELENTACELQKDKRDLEQQVRQIRNQPLPIRGL